MIEIVRPSLSKVPPRVVIFDFDGTLSLIRSGWMDVMVPLCVEQLAALNTGESETQLRTAAEEFIWRLTGKETIYQMMALADAVRVRDGSPLEPLAYKKMYLDRLWLKIRNRIEELQAGRVTPDQYLVPGARNLLVELTRRGMRLYLASGTDDRNVKEEAALLGVAGFFEGRIFGAQDDLASFSKALLVQRIVSRAGGVQPAELLVFGDGYVEIEEVKKVGGRAVGVATAEPDCLEIDDWKRDRLLRAGADFIVPNFLDLPELFRNVFPVSAAGGSGTERGLTPFVTLPTRFTSCIETNSTEYYSVTPEPSIAESENLHPMMIDGKHRPKVLLGDDHHLILDALRTMMGSEFEVATVDNSQSFLEAVETFQPEVAILDINMPGGDGFLTARKVLERQPSLPIVFLSMYGEPRYIDQAAQIGAKAYLSKVAPAQELIDAIHAVLEGESLLPAPLPRDESKTGAGSKSDLTTRQREVLRLIALGSSAKDIANQLNISVRTAEFHRAAIMQRLGLHSTAQMTRYAISNEIA